jgi:hypothetical protein
MTSESSAPSFTNDMNGAILRANDSRSDFYLMELNDMPPLNYDVYYAGWDRSGDAPANVTGIHHPGGDVMKICHYDNSPTKEEDDKSLWNIPDWILGVTEAGSSGSALFDENGRIVGQLYAGRAACNGTVDNGLEDVYGRMDVSWDASGTNSSTRLKDWLDPQGSGVLRIDGYELDVPLADLDVGVIRVSSSPKEYCGGGQVTPEVTIRNFGALPVTSLQVFYQIDGGSAQIFSYSGTIDSRTSETISLPPLTLTVGDHSFEVFTALPNEKQDENTANDFNSYTFTSINGGVVNLNLMLDCYGEETSWEIINDRSATIESGGTYPHSESEQIVIQESFCLDAGCYRFKLLDSYGDGYDGLDEGFCDFNGDYNLTDENEEILDEDDGVAFDGVKLGEEFCVTVSGRKSKYTKGAIVVFPNPTEDRLNVSNTDAFATYTVYTIQGVAVKHGSVENGSLSVSDLENGLYTIAIQTSESVLTTTFIKK